MLNAYSGLYLLQTPRGPRPIGYPPRSGRRIHRLCSIEVGLSMPAFSTPGPYHSYADRQMHPPIGPRLSFVRDEPPRDSSFMSFCPHLIFRTKRGEEIHRMSTLCLFNGIFVIWYNMKSTRSNSECETIRCTHGPS